MKKVYQTIVDRECGNCMQATIASLFELTLEEVPNFIELGDEWHWRMMEFFKEKGYTDICTIYKNRHTTEQLRNIAKFDGGVNGYHYAVVNSKIFEGGTHALVVDSDLNIVHDVNPSETYLSCTPEDVIAVMVVHDMVIGKTGKCFTAEDWNNATEEERNLNTYKVDDK